MLTCVIVDRDKASLSIAEDIVNAITHLQLIQSFESIEDASDILQNNKTNILLIDMEGIHSDELSFLNTLSYERPHIIAMALNTTNALDAFNIDAIDFILKPMTSQSILKALSKILNSPGYVIKGTRNFSNELFIKQNSHFLKIDIKSISHIEALADYVNLYTEAKRFTIHSTMKGMQGRLPEKDFARVHKSYIVRVDRISKIQGKNVMIEKHTIPVSNSFRKTLFERINVI